jgi:hypothetical protein
MSALDPFLPHTPSPLTPLLNLLCIQAFQKFNPPPSSTITSIALTTAGAASGTTSITMTLTGLKLGTIREAVMGGFQMWSSEEDVKSVVVDALAIIPPTAPRSVIFTIGAGERSAGGTRTQTLRV